MTRPADAEAEALDPAQIQVVRRMRRLMLLSTLIMLVGFGIVFGVIAYRISSNPERAAAVETSVDLPAGSRVVSTAVSGDKLVVTIERAGMTEVRVFDLSTLAPRGRMTIRPAP